MNGPGLIQTLRCKPPNRADRNCLRNSFLNPHFFSGKSKTTIRHLPSQPRFHRSSGSQPPRAFKSESIGAEVFVVLEGFRAEDAIFVLVEDGDEVAGGAD